MPETDEGEEVLKDKVRCPYCREEFWKSQRARKAGQLTCPKCGKVNKYGQSDILETEWFENRF
jgi:hypothetical protein